MAQSVDPLYMNKGFVPSEIVTTGIVAMICCVGIGLNSSLVYVTIKTKSLHSPCMILIALYAFFASFLLFGNCVKFVIFVFGINYITLRTCFYIQIVPLICSAITLTFQLCIGLDRLIGVIFPIWYKADGKNVTFKFAIGICCIRSIINGFNAYIGSSAHWEKLATLILLIIWRRESSIPENVKKLTISLIVLMSIGLICYILNIFILRAIMPLLNLDAFPIEYFVIPISFVLQSMAYGSSAPVLYFCSAQYRSAYRTRFAHQANQVTPII